MLFMLVPPKTSDMVPIVHPARNLSGANNLWPESLTAANPRLKPTEAATRDPECYRAKSPRRATPRWTIGFKWISLAGRLRGRTWAVPGPHRRGARAHRQEGDEQRLPDDVDPVVCGPVVCGPLSHISTALSKRRQSRRAQVESAFVLSQLFKKSRLALT
jgi:hypothetical protein